MVPSFHLAALLCSFLCLGSGDYIQVDYLASHGIDTAYIGDTLVSLTTETPSLCALFCNLNDTCGGFNFYYDCELSCCELTGYRFGDTVTQHNAATFYQKVRCPADYIRRHGSTLCYRFVGAHFGYPDALVNCFLDGAYLTSINSQVEQDWLLLNSDFYLSGNVWLGGSDDISEGNWQWEDGQPFLYDNWHPGEPNGDQRYNCVQMWPSIGTWNDANCSLALASICKINLV